MPPAHATKTDAKSPPWAAEDTGRLHLLPEQRQSVRRVPDYRLTAIYISFVLTAIFLLLLVDSLR